MVTLHDVGRIVANISLIVSVVWAYLSLSKAFTQVQSTWKREWSVLATKPDFSFSAEGFKEQDLKMLYFFLLREYEVIPDEKYAESCERVRSKLILFFWLLLVLGMIMVWAW